MQTVNLGEAQPSPQSGQSDQTLAQQVRDWQVLHDMSTRLLKARTLHEQFDVILRTVIDFHQCVQGIISLYDPASACLVRQTAIGFGQAWLEASKHVPVGTGSCGTAFQTRSRVVIDDIDIDHRFVPYAGLAKQEGIRALYSTPFYGSCGEPLGVITVHLGTPRQPSEREMQLADICAGQIALLVERERSEQQLHEELRRSHHILKTMNEGFVLMDQHFQVLQINTEGLRIDGRPEAEIVGRSHWELWPGSENSTVGLAYKKAMTERAPVWFENCHQFDNGEKWFSVHAYPYGDGLALIYRDITELKTTNAQLREAQDRLEATLSAGEVATWIWYIQSDRIWADKNLAKLFGFNEESAMGAPVASYLDMIHPDDVEDVKAAIKQALDEGEYFQKSYRIINKVGGHRWILAQGKIERNADGIAVKMPGVVLDITRQREMEETLRVTEERYRTVLDATDNGFCVVELIFDMSGKPFDYRFVEANPAFERQSGLQNIVGKRIKDIHPGLEQKWFDIYGQVALTGRSISFIEESTSMGRWFDVFASRLGEPEDRYVAVLFNDITQRKRDEAQLRQQALDLSNANRRKTEFIATLAHELRNPLAPMRTGLDFMRLAGNMPSSYAKVHEMMDRQLKQIVHLIDDLLDVARINSGKIELKKERINLKQAIANAVEAAFPLIEAAHHQLDAQVSDKSMFIDADGTRIAQILGNLLANAAKYTPNGGMISLNADRKGNSAVIAITDNGIGIPLAAQQDLFELFSQVPDNLSHAQGGLGIGLSLVRSLAQLHGGTVRVFSEGQGKGSTFIVELPLTEYKKSPLEGSFLSDAISSLKTKKIKILVADDNVDAAQMLKILLEVNNHDVEVVHEGEAALKLAREQHFDLIVLDIGMPRMNGYEVATAIRQLPEGGRAILAALTGWGTKDDLDRAKAAGFDAHLTKPVSLPELKKLISKIENDCKSFI
jgi:PAS domain S-box-containing protein